jgi:hypothetical protein
MAIPDCGRPQLPLPDEDQETQILYTLPEDTVMQCLKCLCACSWVDCYNVASEVQLNDTQIVYLPELEI